MNLARNLLVLATWSLLLGLATLAGSRSSADYAIPAESLDAGGRRSTSASYATEGTFGGLGGLSTASSPALMLRSGYVGQLYDVRSLLITGNPSPVNEGAAMQLSSGLDCDDDTRLALAPTSVSWSVGGGRPPRSRRAAS